jgi:hypothetical protein
MIAMNKIHHMSSLATFHLIDTASTKVVKFFCRIFTESRLIGVPYH